jgi:hypothetical protein
MRKKFSKSLQKLKKEDNNVIPISKNFVKKKD